VFVLVVYVVIALSQKFCMLLTAFEIVKLSVCCMSILGVRHFKAYIMKSEYLLRYCIVFTSVLFLP